MKRTFLVLLFILFASGAKAVDMGDDGLHKAAWMRETFKDLREDLEEANQEGKRLAVIIEQQNCMYCKKMHENVFSDPVIYSYLMKNFFVVQINLFGNIEVTDFDGEVLEEHEMMSKWGVLFTPSMLFFPEKLIEKKSANLIAVASMPGAFSKGTTLDLLVWVNEKLYEVSNASFQRYHAEQYHKRRAASNDK